MVEEWIERRLGEGGRKTKADVHDCYHEDIEKAGVHKTEGDPHRQPMIMMEKPDEDEEKEYLTAKNISKKIFPIKQIFWSSYLPGF